MDIAEFGFLDPKFTDSSEYHDLHEFVRGALLTAEEDVADDPRVFVHAMLDQFIDHAYAMKEQLVVRSAEQAANTVVSVTSDPPDLHFLIEAAGRDPNEKVTRFVMDDYAGAVFDLVDDDFTIEQFVEHLRTVNLSKVGDALCEASGWTEIFQAAAEAM